MPLNDQAAAVQLRQSLVHLAAASAAASDALDALLQVPWYLDLAATAAVDVHVTPNGLLALSSPQHVDEQQQSTQQDDTEQQARICNLLAALLSKLSQQIPSVASHLLQQILPQLRSCQALADNASRLASTTAHNGSRSSISSISSNSTSHWVSLLCTPVAQLHSQGHPDTVHIFGSCVQQLEQLTQNTCGSRAAANALTVGHQACLMLLAAVLAPALSAGSTSVGAGSAPPGNTEKHAHRSGAASYTVHPQSPKTQPSTEQTANTADAAVVHPGLQPALLQRLLDCVVPCIASGELMHPGLPLP